MSKLNVALFIVGWVLFMLAQAQNSIRSNSNGLQGFAGWAGWFQMHVIDLAIRAFLSACFYGFLVQQAAAKIAAAGLSIESYGVAGVSGLAANALLYQVTGLIPGLRVEVPELAPPDATPPAVARPN